MTDYKAEYQITFAHTDGRTKVKSDTMNIEVGSPEEAERIINEQLKYIIERVKKFRPIAILGYTP